MTGRRIHGAWWLAGFAVTVYALITLAGARTGL